MSGAYAFINREKQNLSSFRDSLPNGSGARAKFDRLNPHVTAFSIVMPGELIVVGDSSTSMCTPEDNLLASYARDVRQSLIATDDASARVLTQNYDLLQSIMSYGSLGVGSVTSAWSTHLNQVESTLKDINDAYQRWRAGGLSKDQFVAQCQRLFNVLDGQLRGIGHWGTGLKNNSTIKKMLGISSKSFMRSGEVANYARSVKRINNVARYLSNGTPIGVVLDVGAGVFEIREACSAGREQQCTKAKFVEVGKMMAGIPMSSATGGAGAKVAVSMCFRMAGPTRGASLAICGIAGGAAGGWLGGTRGSKLGAYGGNWLYQLTGDE
ncbi:MAG: hypothetical protein ACRER8_06925 [Pseudomonas sp.]|uniref:hypothetical protein n=1 Tax=Pseudomonas sp. TaxID=306 RepID=UPI003D6E6C16